MNYVSLKYFIIVADELNITKAAQRLYISQQSLSEHISKLEKEYGVKLFERSPRLKLTYAGRCMLRFAEQAVNLDNEMCAQMTDIAQKRKGSISVGMPPAHGRAMAPDILASFHSRYPDVDLHLSIDNSTRLVRHVLDGNLDLAICFNYDAVSPRLERTHYIDDRFCLIIPESILRENFKLTPKELFNGEFQPSMLSSAPIVVSTGQSAVQATFMRYLQQKNVRCIKEIAAIRDHQTRLLLCSRGLGVTFSFQQVAQSFIREYRSPQKLYCIPLDISDKQHDHSLSICYLHDRYLSNAGSCFIRVAQEMVGKLLTVSP